MLWLLLLLLLVRYLEPVSWAWLELNFLECMNSIDHNNQFTCEDSREDGSITFLEMLNIPEEDGRLSTTVYRMPTHTDLYLHWDSHHAISSKYSVVGTLYQRAKPFCYRPEQLQKEEQHLSQALIKMQVSNMGT